MHESLKERKLSNGDFFVFNHHTKNLYLISKANQKYWEKSKKDEAALKEMVAAKQADFFDKTLLGK